MSNKFETIIGKFAFCVYKSDSYMVSSFETDDGHITVTGPFFNYERKKKYVLTGEFVEHPKYGFQFNYHVIDEYLSKVDNEIISFLSSPAFKGIGEKTAVKIYDYFGDDTLSILKNDPQAIIQVGLKEKTNQNIIDGFTNLQDPKNEIILKLIAGGFTNNESLFIYDNFKDKTVEVINDNPYRIYLDVYGINFQKVCEFASKLEFEDKLNKYKEAYLVYVFKQVSFSLGDTYLLENDFRHYYEEYFKADDFEEIVNMSIKDKYLLINENKYFLFNEYYDEEIIGDFLSNLHGDLNIDDNELNYAINNLSNELDITYDLNQIDAIKSFFQNDISIITGGPGTGKTTVVKSMVNIFKNYLPFNNIVIVAPTGRAAKRISEICDVESKTIHSLLRWNKETNTFAYNFENPLMYDAIIIDEFSMVDNFLFAALLRASSNISKICLIGDDNQLPSIRQGNVLLDLINSNMFKITRLKNNYRQALGNQIINLSYDVIDESINFNNYEPDVRFIEEISTENLISLIDQDILDGYNFDDIQVLAPMYKGILGIDNLNVVLQEYFNEKSKDKKEHKVGNKLYRENDKILQLKNRPTDDVYNGDIGILEEINEKDKYFLINFSGIYVYYKFDDLIDISHAYAMSVHKAQGSEYKVVYFIIPNINNVLLNKKLIYTAITRAKEKLVIIGNKNNFIAGAYKNLKNRKTDLLNKLNK